MDSETLKQWRLQHGDMSQRELAQRLRVRYATIADWERGASGKKILESFILDLALKELGGQIDEERHVEKTRTSDDTATA